MTALDRLEAEFHHALRPPPKLSLSQWADEFAVLSAESSAEVGRWKTLPYQREMMDAITDPAVTQVTVLKSARVGYALSIDTEIPTPTGYARMGDLQSGDQVFDELGRPTTIQYVSPVFTDHDCYRITFCDGSSIVADAGHRWFVQADKSLQHLLIGKVGRVGRPKPGETKSMSGVISTEEMARIYLDHRGRRCLAIPLTNPLDLPDAKLPIPPYMLGVWLGDGYAESPRVTKSIFDCEIAQYIEEEGVKTEVVQTDTRTSTPRTIFFDRVDGRISKWAAVFRKLGLFEKKFIPEIYFRGSICQRLSLVRGLMDTDGTVRADGYCELSITSKEIADGLCELLASLGVKYTRSQREPTRNGYLHQYRVRFRANGRHNPFRLKRKADRAAPPKKPSEVMRRRIWSVERIETVPVRCIEVDSASSLFLAGRQVMVPTHNTKILNHVIAYHIHQDPCSMMLVQPTIEDAEGYSKEEIAPMIRDTPCLQGLVIDAKAKDSANTILQKMFPGGTLSLVGANSPRGFRRVSRRIVLFDEVDGYPESAGTEGDQIKLGTRRTEYFWNRKIIAGSTPLVKETSRIDRLYQESDQRRYFVPCPSCGEFQYLKWGGPGKPFGIKWPENEPEKAFYLCEKKACEIPHEKKRWMIERGQWRATADGKRGHVGFHIWAAYSYSPNAGWGDLASEFVAIQKRRDRHELKTFVNTVLGETWEEEYTAKLGAEGLRARVEMYQPGIVPAKALALTAGVDVQDNRFAVSIYGWGPGEESWLISHQEIFGDPAKPEIWKQLDDVLLRAYRTETGAELWIRVAAIDTGGHHTHESYQYVRQRRGHARVRIIAVKGHSQRGRPAIGKPTKQDINFKGQPLKFGVDLYMVGTDTIKSTLYGRLKLEEAGPGFVHFPAGLPEEFFEQLTAEKKIIRYLRGFPVAEWVKEAGKRNEALDCAVYAYAALQFLYTRYNRQTIWAQLERELGRQGVPVPAPSAPAEAATDAPTQSPAPAAAQPPLQKPAPARNMGLNKRPGGFVKRW